MPGGAHQAYQAVPAIHVGFLQTVVLAHTPTCKINDFQPFDEIAYLVFQHVPEIDRAILFSMD